MVGNGKSIKNAGNVLGRLRSCLSSLQSIDRILIDLVIEAEQEGYSADRKAILKKAHEGVSLAVGELGKV